MNITHAPVRRSLVAAVALGAGLTLAACGGGDDEESPATMDAPAEAPSGGDETGSDEPGVGESPSESGSDDAAGAPGGGESESEAGSAGPGPGPGGESESGAAGEERIEITWPEGWEDLQADAAGPLPQGVAEMHSYALDPAEPFPTGASVTRYAPGTIGDGSYIELLEQSGQDTSELTEIEPRDIAGHDAEGLEFEQDPGEGEMRQRAYGFPLDDGSFVEVSLQAPVEQFDTHEADFESILDSITIS
ncbi:hypothetical protein [Georgenia sp. Z1491]|uniref:hypothetical protein n=1 Tax=Georgenia sp. Z1491 TaxID=3416707 RepID=UPI003CEDEA4F